MCIKNYIQFDKTLLVLIAISLASCNYYIKYSTIPEKISCQDVNCCYDINGSNKIQICGTASLNKGQVFIKYSN